MALVELIDPTDVNMTLAAAFSDHLGWQMDAGELDRRLDDAAYAVARILNTPFYESDLGPNERAEAEAAYLAQPYAVRDS